MNLFRVMDISGSALLAERLRAEVTAANLANAETTKTESGGPYQRMNVIFGAHPASVGFNGMMLASLADLHAEGATVCLVTHDPRYARDARKTIHLFDGRIANEEVAAV